MMMLMLMLYVLLSCECTDIKITKLEVLRRYFYNFVDSPVDIRQPSNNSIAPQIPQVPSRPPCRVMHMSALVKFTSLLGPVLRMSITFLFFLRYQSEVSI